MAENGSSPPENRKHSRTGNRNRTNSESGTSITSSSSSYTLKAPDGGWGWVVVAAAFFVNMIADGVTFSFTYLFQELEKEFGQSKAVTSFAVSMFHAVPLLVGPIASALTDRYGCRMVTIVGSLLAAMGFFLSSFAPSLEVIYFTCGVLAGFGLSMPYVAAMVIVTKYFDEKLSFAVGIACCGSGIGTLVFAEFIEFLINDAQLSWRDTFQVLAGCFLFMCVCGLFYTELELIPKNLAGDDIIIEGVGEESEVEGEHDVNANSAGGMKPPDVEELKQLLKSNTASAFPPLVLSSQEINRFDVGPPMMGATSGNIRISSSLVNFPTYLTAGIATGTAVTAGINNLSLDVSSSEYTGPPAGAQNGNGRLLLDPTLIQIKVEESAAAAAALKRSTAPPAQESAATVAPAAKKRPAVLERTSSHLNHLKIRRQSLAYRRAMLSTAKYSLRASSSCPDIYRNAISGNRKGRGQSDLLDTDGEGMTAVCDSGCHPVDSGCLSSTKAAGCCAAAVAVLEHLPCLTVSNGSGGIRSWSKFCNIGFILFLLSNFVLYAFYDIMYTFLPDYAVGDLKWTSNNLLSLIGIFNTVGEVLVGYLGDKEWIDLNCFYAACMAVCGTCSILVPFLSNQWALAAVSAIFGFAIAANYSLTTPILVELVSIRDYCNAYGLLLLVQGVANLLGPPFAGWLYDTTQEWYLTFGVGGANIILSGLLLVIVPAVTCLRRIGTKQSGIKSTNMNRSAQV